MTALEARAAVCIAARAAGVAALDTPASIVKRARAILAAAR